MTWLTLLTVFLAGVLVGIVGLTVVACLVTAYDARWQPSDRLERLRDVVKR